jgi:hypothetical protein
MKVIVEERVEEIRRLLAIIEAKDGKLEGAAVDMRLLLEERDAAITRAEKLRKVLVAASRLIFPVRRCEYRRGPLNDDVHANPCADCEANLGRLERLLDEAVAATDPAGRVAYQEITSDYRSALLKSHPTVLVSEIEKLRDMLGRAQAQAAESMRERCVAILRTWDLAADAGSDTAATIFGALLLEKARTRLEALPLEET